MAPGGGCGPRFERRKQISLEAHLFSCIWMSEQPQTFRSNETQDKSQASPDLAVLSLWPSSRSRTPVSLPVSSLSQSRPSRSLVPLAVSSFSQSRPSRTLAGAAPLAPTARRCARKNRSATPIRAGAPSRTVFVAIPTPVCPRGPSWASSPRPGCPRRPLRAAASRQCAIAARFLGHPRAVVPQKTIFCPYFCRYPTCNQALMKIPGDRSQGPVARHSNVEFGGARSRSQESAVKNHPPEI